MHALEVSERDEFEPFSNPITVEIVLVWVEITMEFAFPVDDSPQSTGGVRGESCELTTERLEVGCSVGWMHNIIQMAGNMLLAELRQ
jgi:hypothetical protein